MLTCRCGKKARLDDVDGTKPGKRVLYYICDCNTGYKYNEKTKELRMQADEDDLPLPF